MANIDGLGKIGKFLVKELAYLRACAESQGFISRNLNQSYIEKHENKIAEELKLLKDWQIETVDRYWFRNGTYSKRYVETTFWYEANTLERKETTRSIDVADGMEHIMPEWSKSISERRSILERN